MAVLALGAAIPPVASAVGVYVSNFDSNSVSVFSTGPDGALSPVSCDPATSCATGNTPVDVAIDPTGRHLYVNNDNSPGSVSVFSIGADGALSPVTCDPDTSCKTGNFPIGIAVDPTGHHVYVTNVGSDSVSVYSIGAGGALSPVTCDPTTSCKTGGAGAPAGIAIDPAGRHVYVINQNPPSSVSVFSIGADGALSPVTCDPATSCKTGKTPVGITVDPAGRHLYVANFFSDSVSVFSIGADGVLSPVACDPTTLCKTGSEPGFVAIDPAGRHLYVNNESSGSVSVFSISADGALSPVTCDPNTVCKTGTSPEGIAVDPAGRHLYVANHDSNSVSVFSISAAGALTPVTCDPATSCKTGSHPDGAALVVSPDRGPTATLTARPAPAGSASAFDASSSSSPDYPISTYAWNFGDGNVAPDDGPKTAHTYSAAGRYTVTLTVTDDAGCSTGRVFTGQTVSCNGGPKATISHLVTISPPHVKITSAQVSSKRRRARFSFKALGAKSRFQCALTKRAKSKKHAKPRFKACRSPKTYKHLKPGRYTFRVRAVGSGLHGKPARKAFTIRAHAR